MTLNPLPLGIRNNNPGNLRQAYGMSYKTELVDGFAKFKSLSDGVEALCRLTSDYYTVHGLRTLPQFISRYAPASENDVAAYVRQMVLLLHVDPLRVNTADTNLDRGWAALHFMRAIIIVENGNAPASWLPPCEWIDLTTWTACMHRSTKWRIV